MFALLLPVLYLATQGVAPKPAGFLGEAQQWIREHAGDWQQGNFLSERLRRTKSVVLVLPTQPGAASPISKRCFEVLLAGDEPLCIGLPAGWEDVRALDSWLADGKGAPGTLLEKSILELARAWNAEEKHARKLRAAGIDYRATREEAFGLTEFVGRIDPLAEHRTGDLLSPFRQIGPDGQHRYGQVDDNWRFAVNSLLQELEGQVAERRAEWEKELGQALVAAGLRNLMRIRQAEVASSKPAEFRRGRALCQNAAAARDELAPGSLLVACVPGDAQLEAQDAHAALGESTLVLLILAPGEDPDFAALSSVRASGVLDLRELPKEGPLAAWFAAHLGKRADLVLWAGAR